MGITCKEIAEQLGVSRQAVYSVLSSKSVCHVSAEKKERILFLARAYHYKPNQAALHLLGKEKKTKRIGVVTDAFFGIEGHDLTRLSWLLAGLDYTMDVRVCTGVAEGLRSLMEFAASGVDGLIFSGQMLSPDYAQLGVPAVGLVTEVGTDIRGGICDLTRHLIRVHGHRRLLLHGDEMEVTQKYAGFAEAVREASLPLLPPLRSLGNDHFEEELLAHIRSGVTAVVCQGDDGAALMIHMLRQHGIRVPEDVAVTGFCGFDNHPGICTAKYPSGRNAELIWEVLSRKIRDNILEPLDIPKIRPVIVPAESCGCTGGLIRNICYKFDLDGDVVLKDEV